MAKKIMKILCFLAVFVILTSAVQIPVFALSDSITSVSATFARSANEKVSALQADQEVKFNGTSIEYFSSTGTCSWNVRVDTIVSGPSELQGHTVTVALWSGDSGEFPSGSMDPEIEPGDKIEVYGLYVGEDYVTLSGSEEYYITKTSASNQLSVTVRYPNGGESISIGTQVQVSAHATDDNAVTGVTFYYSCDGGSNWDIIGEGVKVSGTDKDGVWNRTWNTDGLSAGTNYMIKAVASDGTSTSEDQSDSTFSLVGTITPVEEWSRTFGGTGDDFATTVQQTSDGGYIIAGAKSLKSDGNDVTTEAWLVKTDSKGNKQWDKTFGCTDGVDIALSVQQTLDGGYIFAGLTPSNEGWLVKTDSHGNTQWEKTVSTVFVMAVLQTSDGSYILAGGKADSSDGRLMKIDPYGNTQWEKTFGGPDDDMLTAIQQTSDGGYILAGATESYGGDIDGWLVKTDQNGNQQWEKTFGGIGYGLGESVRQTSDGGYILASVTTSADFWLVKTDPNGNKQWEKTFGDAGGEMVGAVQTRDGGYILAGTTESYGAGSSDGWLVRTDSNGNEQWEKTFGGPGDDGLTAIQQTSDGGYILAGITDSYGAGATDFWLIKVKEGEAEITDGNTITNTIGMEFVLIPAGKFDMGSPSDEEDRWSAEGPVHHVNIGKAFYMGRYEVTQKQWRAIMGDNPSYFKGDNLPVEQVSWYDAQEFIRKLNEKESTDKYRLPSEAEWEYACRAGTITKYSFGDSESNLGDYAWYDDNSDLKTHPVGQKKPNPWGLYDLYGNVREWVQDTLSDYNGAPTDGSAWESGDGTYRVSRGGGCNYGAGACRSAFRNFEGSNRSLSNLGFRLLKEQ